MKARLFVFILLILVGIFSCKKDKGTVPNGPKLTSCDTTTITTYTNYVASILATNCNLSGCHDNGSGNGDFTTYAGIMLKVNSGAFKTRVLDLKDMPASYSSGPTVLDDCTLFRLKRWIEAGSPQ